MISFELYMFSMVIASGVYFICGIIAGRDSKK